MEKTKPFNIPKKLFVQAYKLVKANAGAAGVDEQSLEDFDKNLKDNLYKLWMILIRFNGGIEKPFC